MSTPETEAPTEAELRHQLAAIDRPVTPGGPIGPDRASFAAGWNAAIAYAADHPATTARVHADARVDAAEAKVAQLAALLPSVPHADDCDQAWVATKACVCWRDDLRRSLAEDLGDDATPGCGCTSLCEMGPTCPGGMLAGLPGSGCARTQPAGPLLWDGDQA